jgi:WD40 repeat protein
MSIAVCLILIMLFGPFPNPTHANQKGIPGFSPDGAVVATPDKTGRIILWETATGKQIAAVYEPVSETTKGTSQLKWDPEFSFSPDGRVLASTRGNEGISLWTVPGGTLSHRLKSSGVSSDIRFSVNSRIVAAISVTNKTAIAPKTITVWEVGSGKKLLEISHGSDFELTRWFFSPNARLLMAGWRSRQDGDTIELWDVEKAEAPERIDGHSASFSPDGKYLLFKRKEIEIKDSSPYPSPASAYTL